MADYSAMFGRGGLNDQVDADALLTDIGLDDDEIAWRKDFIDFGPDEVTRLERLQSLFEANAEEIGDRFYENLTQYDQTVEVIGRSPKAVDALKQTQQAYFATLAGGEYGAEYFRNRARIGKLHDVLGMPMKHYIGQYGVYYDLVLPLLTERASDRIHDRVASVLAAATDGGVAADATPSEDETLDAVQTAVDEELTELREEVSAVLRIINLDMQVVADTYIHSYSEQLEDEVRRRERLAAEVEADLEAPMGELRRSADSVADSSQQIADLTAEQSERVQSIASEVSNMSATVEEVAASASEVEHNSEQARDLADDGQDAADDAMAVMDDVGDAVDEVAEDVDELQDRVGEIDAVVEVIDDIAEQTNILALNASIEAARAGEAGSGFAVVADEVKSLAGESKARAEEIESLVAAIQSDTEDTVDSLAETTTQIERGFDRVGEAMELLDDIAAAVEETATGIREVSEATDDQAASTEEVASMLDELVAQADTVAAEVQQIAAANEQQAATIDEVAQNVQRLTE